VSGFPKSWLEQQTKTQLIKMLETRCVTDSALLEHLKLKAAAANPTDNLKKIHNLIYNAFWIEDYVHRGEVFSYTTQLDDVIETLKQMNDQGQSEAVVELVEEAFDCWVEAVNCIHDDGEMGTVLDELHELHLNACRKSVPDPEQLAEDLFLTGYQSNWNILSSAYSVYASVLGETGRKHYRELTEKKWAKLPVLKPGKEDPKRYENRSDWLDRLMVQFAQEEDDFERECEIRQRDLSKGWNFLQMAERHIEAKRQDAALAWVENGLHYFPDEVRLKRICAELYRKTKRPNDALRVWWNLFEANRTLETYKALVAQAGKMCKRTEWQTKAIASIRAYIAAAQGKKQYYWNCIDHSLLVEIFLWEGDPEQAWLEAEKGGCSTDLWLKLCKKREADRPADVYPIYMKLAEESVMRKKNEAYRIAIKRIKAARQLAERCEQPGAFDAMLSKIKIMHKPKRNFMKYLAEAGL